MTPPAPRLRRLLAPLVVLAAIASLLVAPPRAEANCGKSVIDQYFSTGRIQYHPQNCYALALRQIDPDARMYSGIMAAIRAARARDRARDTRGDEPPAPAPSPVEPGAPPPEPVELLEDVIEEAEETTPETTGEPTMEERTLDETVATAIAAPAYDEPALTPLAVLMLGGLASLATATGLVGVAIRRLTGRL